MTGSDKPRHKAPPQMTGVVVFGSINADLTGKTDSWPPASFVKRLAKAVLCGLAQISASHR